MRATARGRGGLWVAWLVVALLLLDVVDLPVYGVVVPVSGLVLASIPGTLAALPVAADARDLRMISWLYGLVVALMYAAFQLFTVERTPGLFLCFAAALLVGTVGPIVYTCWLRDRPMADLGLRLDNWRAAVALGVLLAVVAFALTLSGPPRSWASSTSSVSWSPPSSWPTDTNTGRGPRWQPSLCCRWGAES